MTRTRFLLRDQVEKFLNELRNWSARKNYVFEIKPVKKTNIYTISIYNRNYSIYDNRYYVADMIFNPENRYLFIKFINTRDYPNILSEIREIISRHNLRTNIR